MRQLMLLFAAFSFLVASGCGSSPPSIATLKFARAVTVYEGLPHQLREADSFDQESQRPDVTTIGAFPFYTPGVAANEQQVVQLKNILGNRSNYVTYTVPTDCGPFHPDFAVEWSVGEVAHRILICFSCDEARIVSKGEEATFGFNGIDDLKPVLSEFASKRPKQ